MAGVNVNHFLGGIPFGAERLARYPEGYRHLGYVQELAGMQVNPSLPGRNGPELDRLYQRGRAWLAAGPQDELPIDGERGELQFD